MKASTESIVDLLERSQFENIDSIPELVDEHDLTDQRNEWDIEESIVKLNGSIKLIETAIEHDVLGSFTQKERDRIHELLDEIRKDIRRMEKGKTRNNPGKKFIINVQKLHRYLVNTLALDIRVGEQLEFSEQLAKLSAIRTEQQETVQTLSEAEELVEQANEILEQITSFESHANTQIENISETHESIKSHQKEVESLTENVREEANTVRNKYENVLEQTADIEDKDERLDNNLAEIEARSEDLDDQVKRSEEIQETINDLLSGAIGTSLGKNFDDRKQELKRSAIFWAAATFASVGVLIGFSAWVFQGITGGDNLGLSTISKATVIVPVLIAVWFTSKNYSQTRKLMEEYAFKSTISQTLEPSRDVLDNQLPDEDDDKMVSKFMMVSMSQIFTNPNKTVHGSATDDDITNIERMREYTDDVLGRN